jgi:hypothetical protein
MFDDVLRVFAGRKLGEDAIAFNVVAVNGTSKLPRYEPIQYAFIPKKQLSPEELTTLVKYLNLAVYTNPGTYFVSSHKSDCSSGA